ncbi:MAG: DUF993 family protein [Planctomycetota bacterium]|nr:MAG: DUF993 family protein [Planctomycetota bacterium]
MDPSPWGCGHAIPARAGIPTTTRARPESKEDQTSIRDRPASSPRSKGMTLASLTPPAEAPITIDDEVLAPARAELAALDAAAGGPPPPCRLAYAAAHVVAAPNGDGVDWAATFALRRRLAGHGLGIAEAMDTAQRFELGWGVAERLIRGTGALGLPHGFVAGAAADHWPAPGPTTPEEVGRAWAEQAALIRAAGGTPVLLPEPRLCAWGCGPDAFVAAYRAALEHSEGELFLHWLGPMFHPGLVGYFPGDSLERILALAPERIRGVKLSLLDAGRERALRRRLRPRGQIVLTGDDHHFAALIAGEPDDPADFSHALLGVLEAIAAPAGLALRFLAHGRRDRFLKLMEPCEALGRHLFAAPVAHYQAGLAFLAWLNGWQEHRRLPAGAHRRRDRAHLLAAARLAAAAGCLEDAPLAAERLARFAAGGED